MVSADSVFRAIAHPGRRKIIGLLAKSSRSVKELTAQFEISQAAISQHLKELRKADLVSSERVALEQRYRLTPQPLKHVLRWCDSYRSIVDPAGHMWSLGRKIKKSGK